MRREFVLQDDRSNKFWTIEVTGSRVVTGNGRIGTRPRETTSDYPTKTAAQAAADREILGKRRKGYVECPIERAPPWRKGLPPRRLRIRHDDYHACYVGKTRRGQSFFLTFPFAPRQADDPGGSYIALYLFDEFGEFADARILEPAAQGLTSQTAVDAYVQGMLEELGGHRFGDISVAPFAVQAFGREFGLIFDPGDAAEEGSEDGDEDEDEPSSWVTVEPGNYMAFYPPWEGDYDT